jgi:hypothetical protein
VAIPVLAKLVIKDTSSASRLAGVGGTGHDVDAAAGLSRLFPHVQVDGSAQAGPL